MQRTSSLAFIFVTLLIDILGMSLLFPVLPKFISELTHQSLSDSAPTYGHLLAIFGLMQFVFSPMLGTLSDRFGRRPILLISLFFASLDYVLMALAPSMIWLYIGRTISGITGASFTAASAYIADVSPPEKRSQNFGLIGAAFGVGFIIGPAVGGLLGQISPRAPFWAAAILCFANFLYGWFILPESLKPENRRAFSWRQANPLVALKILSKYPLVWGLTGSLIASNLAMNCIHSTWVLYTMTRFGWGPTETGLSLAAFGTIALIYQLGLARFLLPMWGDRRAMLIGLGVGSIECAAYGLSSHGWMIYAIMILGGVGLLGGQAVQGLLSKQVGDDEQGQLQGALVSLASLTGIVAPVLATSLFGYFTGPKSPWHMPGVSFFLGAALNTLAFVIALKVSRIHRKAIDATATTAAA